MPLIPPVPASTPTLDPKPVSAAAAAAGLSARERHKLTKGRTVEMDEKEIRDLKRKVRRPIRAAVHQCQCHCVKAWPRGLSLASFSASTCRDAPHAACKG